MENSIEDIEEKLNKNLDFLIENANKMEQLTAVNIVAMKQPIILLFLSILSEYKRVLKENEELRIVKSAIQTLQINSIEDEKYIVISKSSFLDGSYKHLIDEYIPKQKVKEKIEKYKNMCISNAKGYENYFKDNYDELVFRKMEQLEKELLESEEKRKDNNEYA